LAEKTTAIIMTARLRVATFYELTGILQYLTDMRQLWISTLFVRIRSRASASVAKLDITLQLALLLVSMISNPGPGFIARTMYRVCSALFTSRHVAFA
jgi:hypothetical protein